MLSYTKNDGKIQLFYSGEFLFESKVKNPSPIKFETFVWNWIEKLSEKVEWFRDFFGNMVVDYYKTNPELRFDIVRKNIPKIIEANEEIEKIDPIDYERFIDRTRIKSGSVVFEPEDIKKITVTSNILKTFHFFIQLEDIRLPDLLAKEIFNDIIKYLGMDVVSKILAVIKTKSYRCTLTNRHVWEYIKQMRAHDTECQIAHIFIFIMNNILVLCERGKNPITFIVSSINCQLSWFLRTVYRDVFKYDAEIAVEDVEPVDNLAAYTYNYSIGQLLEISRKRIDDLIYSQTMYFDESIFKLDNLEQEAKFIPPVAEYITYPILSRTFKIPYEYFRALKASHSIHLNLHLKLVLEENGIELPNLISLLEHYPTSRPPLFSSTRLKSVSLFINNSFSKIFNEMISSASFYDLVRGFVSKVARNKYKNIFNDKIITWPQAPLEEDTIKFYTMWFKDDVSFLKKIEKKFLKP